MTEADILLALRKRFGPPEYAFLPQVRNGTGFSRKARTADLLALSTWPSRGIHLHGFEIKTARGDWLRELKQPEKAEEIGRFCNFWWIAEADDSIVQANELPPAWGLISVTGRKQKQQGLAFQEEPKPDRLRILKQATFRKDPEPLTLLMLASIFRSLGDTTIALTNIDNQLRTEHRKGFDKGLAQGKNGADREAENARRNLQDLTASVAAFEKASGIRMDRYSQHFAGEIGAAVEYIRSNPHKADELAELRKTVTQLLEDLGKREAAFRAVAKPETS